MSDLVTKAPGKIMIAGEYAVLFGCPAIVANVSHEAICTFTPGVTLEFSAHTGHNVYDTSLWNAVIKTCALAGIEAHVGTYKLDTSAFFHAHSGQKLGLGSSAAATATLIKMIFRQHGIINKDLLLALALKSHREFSFGLGSGADVAASICGEFIRYECAEPFPRITPLVPHEFFQGLLVIPTNRSQNTRNFVPSVMRMRNHSSRFLDSFCEASTHACEMLLHANTESDFMEGMDEIYSWMLALGDHANIDIVSPEHAAIYSLAKSLGGTAKPSGAGGGDIAIAYVPLAKRHQLQSDFPKAFRLHW